MSDDNYPIYSPRKLIEVALPLDAINKACAYEKMPGIGAHPRGIHLWWARRPLAAARSIIFAQLVNDPGYQQGGGFKYGMNKRDAAIERKRLFRIIEELVLWENTTNEKVLEAARVEIRRSWREVCELNKNHPRAAELFNPDSSPGLHDPFAGGGAIPLEAQRLGLEAYATDLNPVAVLLNKAMIEIPPRFAGRAPVCPLGTTNKSSKLPMTEKWVGAAGLAEDVRRYGAWMCVEVRKRIGHIYPPIEIRSEMLSRRPDLSGLVGRRLKPIAWLWARTVKSPNPAFAAIDVPLISTFVLANAEGRQAYVAPIIGSGNYHFEVRMGVPPPEASNGTKASGRGANFRCLLSGSPISATYIRSEGQAGRIGQRLMAIVAEGQRGRVYLSPTTEADAAARQSDVSWKPDIEFFKDALGFRIGNYGLSRWSDLFAPRQLIALNTLSELVCEARQLIFREAVAHSMQNDELGLEAGGSGAKAYSEAVSVYLAFAVDRCADFCNAVTRWVPGNQKVMNLFGKQTIPMTWDFPEAAILEDTVGGMAPAVNYIADCIDTLLPLAPGCACQADAQTQTVSRLKAVSTDPPYYDNIGYADLSDFFYVWLRRSLRSVFPSLFSTISVPKMEELVATPVRHGTKDQADAFFLDGMTKAIRNLACQSHPEGPVTIYYAFKQAETGESSDTLSTGWETFLTAVLRAGFTIVGTWPLRSEQEFRGRAIESNALASSIVLVCRRRPTSAVASSRREFVRELNTVLPEALDEMTRGSGDGRSPVAPVDLSQAIIGPGMAVFSKYSAVLEADGAPMSVGTALQLINRFLAEEDFDADTHFCLRWFEENRWADGAYGKADVLARAKATSVNGLAVAGVLKSGGGNVRIVKWSDYPEKWERKGDRRASVWEVLHFFIRGLKAEGESGVAVFLAAAKNKAEAARQLAYRLYTLCERQGWAEDARVYNEIITSWAGIETAAAQVPEPDYQGRLFE